MVGGGVASFVGRSWIESIHLDAASLHSPEDRSRPDRIDKLRATASDIAPTLVQCATLEDRSLMHAHDRLRTRQPFTGQLIKARNGLVETIGGNGRVRGGRLVGILCQTSLQ